MRRLILAQHALLIAAEAAWLAAWSSALGHWLGASREPLLAVPELLGLLALAAALARVAVAARRPRLAGVSLGALGLAVALLVAFGPWLAAAGWTDWAGAWRRLVGAGADLRAVGVLGSVLFVWWRGVRSGRARPAAHVVEQAFWTGVVALAGLLAVVALAGPGAEPARSLALPTLAFLFVGLVALPLARVADVATGRPSDQRSALTPSGPWLAMLLAVVTAVLLVALLVAQVATFERIEALWEPLGNLLGSVLYVILLPFAYLVEALVWLARRFLRRRAPAPLDVPSAPNVLEELRKMGGAGQPVAPELLLALKVLALIALAAAIVGLLARAVARLQRRDEPDEVAEVRDLVWAWPGFVAIWRWLTAWLRPRLVRVVSLAAPARPAARAAPSVRELYRGFLALGAAIGRPRARAETPLEYERRLGADPALPGAGEAHSITAAYVRTRYGPPSPGEPDLGPLAAALARLREAWQGLSAEKD